VKDGVVLLLTGNQKFWIFFILFWSLILLLLAITIYGHSKGWWDLIDYT